MSLACSTAVRAVARSDAGIVPPDALVIARLVNQIKSLKDADIQLVQLQYIVDDLQTDFNKKNPVLA